MLLNTSTRRARGSRTGEVSPRRHGDTEIVGEWWVIRSPSDRASAIDVQRLPGDHRRLIRGEVEGAPRGILGGLQATQRHVPAMLLQPIHVVALQALNTDLTRRDDPPGIQEVHPHPM